MSLKIHDLALIHAFNPLWSPLPCFYSIWSPSPPSLFISNPASSFFPFHLKSFIFVLILEFIGHLLSLLNRYLTSSLNMAFVYILDTFRICLRKKEQFICIPWHFVYFLHKMTFVHEKNKLKPYVIFVNLYNNLDFLKDLMPIIVGQFLFLFFLIY